MTLSLRDTLSRSVRPVEPIEPGLVRMYTCGPTVYRYAHVGNLRSYLLADLIRRTLLYHGLERLPRQEHHRRGPPARRAVRPRRGPDAGPGRARAQDAGRDRRRVRGRVPRRRGARQHPARERLPAGDRARRRDGRPRRAARGRRPCLRLRGGQPLLLGRVVPRLRPAVGQHARRAARRASRGDRAGQAGLGRLRALEGRRRGPPAQMADAALGRGLPGLASRMLGDGHALPRGPLRHPHRRHRQRLPASRGRDRPVGAVRRRRPGEPLGPRRVPADVGQEDGEVGRQLPARHRAARSRHRPAGLPLPRADLPLRPQARLLRRVDRRCRGGADLAAGASARARRAARRRAVAAAGPAPGRGGRRPADRHRRWGSRPRRR